jgi:hypothetical protein
VLRAGSDLVADIHYAKRVVSISGRARRIHPVGADSVGMAPFSGGEQKKTRPQCLWGQNPLTVHNVIVTADIALESRQEFVLEVSARIEATIENEKKSADRDSERLTSR